MINGADGEIHVILDRRPAAARHARDAVMELLGDGPPVDFIRDAVLLTSELVSNAVTHGAGRCELRAAFHAPTAHLRVEVTDGSAAMPNMADPEQQQARVGGLGLVLVARVAARWGVDEADDGKAVWFEMTG